MSTPRSTGHVAILLGLERVPCVVYPATISAPRVSFTTLCAEHLTKTETVVRCPGKPKGKASTSHLIEKADKPTKLVSGFELGRDVYLPLTDEELAEVAPEPESEITIEAFIELAAIEPIYFTGSAQLLGADVGDGPVTDARAARSYSALVYALLEGSEGEGGLAALGRWQKSGHDRLVAIVAQDRRLLALELRRAGEVRDVTEVPAAVMAPGEGLDVLDPLVKRLKLESYDPSQYQDARYEATVALLAKKVAERALKPTPRRKTR